MNIIQIENQLVCPFCETNQIDLRGVLTDLSYPPTIKIHYRCLNHPNSHLFYLRIQNYVDLDNPLKFYWRVEKCYKCHENHGDHKEPKNHNKQSE